MKRTLFILLALSATCLAPQQTAAQEKRMAVVELSSNYMRQRPDYESGLETQELMGTVVEIVGEDRYWREIICPQPYRAWATSMGLVEMNAKELEAYQQAPKYIYTAETGHLFSAPSAESEVICDLVGGDILRACIKEKHTGKNSAEAYSRKHFKGKGKWAEAMLPSGRTGYVLKNEVSVYHEWKKNTVPTVESFIRTAEKMLGVPYLWGGMTFKGVDCSGLVRVSAILNNFNLPRNASQQIDCGQKVDMDVNPEFWNEDKRTDRNGYSEEFIAEMKTRVTNLKRGDLVFFGYPATPEKKARITHVGIYLGNNQIIHSSHMVRKNSLLPGEKDFYENSHRLLSAIRLNLL